MTPKCAGQKALLFSRWARIRNTMMFPCSLTRFTQRLLKNNKINTRSRDNVPSMLNWTERREPPLWIPDLTDLRSGLTGYDILKTNGDRREAKGSSAASLELHRTSLNNLPRLPVYWPLTDRKKPSIVLRMSWDRVILRCLPSRMMVWWNETQECGN